MLDVSFFFKQGDDDQSIYAFRGAQCVNNIDEYLKALYLEKENSEHIIKLEQNYREFINSEAMNDENFLFRKYKYCFRSSEFSY